MGLGPFSTPPIEGGGGGGGGVSGLTTADGGTAIADNAIIRGDGTEGIQGSIWALSDAGDLTSSSGLTLIAGAGKNLNLTPGAGGNIAFNGNALSVGSNSVLTNFFTEALASTPVNADANYARYLYSNEGAAAQIVVTLPTAVAGKDFTFVIQDADGFRVTANTGDTIRVIDKVTAAAGYIESTTIGSVVRLVAINATEWFAVSIHGVWTDGTFTYDDTGNTSP